MKVARWEGWTLAAILALALALRLYRLDAPLWYDEVFTLVHFVRERWGDLLTDFSSLNNHMFYSLQGKAAVALLGESAWALRMPAVLFGVASLPVTWAMWREPAGRVAALFAVLLLAISYHHVWFSQNARGYTGLLFWTSLATLLLVDGLRRPSWGRAIGYGLCLAAGMYTHLSAGFFFAAHAVVYAGAWLLYRRGRLRDYPGLRDISPFAGFAIGGVVTLLLHLPLFGQVLSAMNRVSAGKTSSSMAEWSNPLRMVREIAGSLDQLGALGPVVLLAALVVIAVGLAALARRAPLLVAIYALSIPLALALLLALDFRIWPRYFFVDIGFVFVCVAVGAVALAGWFARLIGLPRVEPYLFVAGAAIAAAASVMLLARNYAEPKQDFAGAVALIEASRAPGDHATSLGLASEPLSTYFAPRWPVVRSRADLLALEAQGGRVWVVTGFDDKGESDQADAFARLARDYTLVRSFNGTLGGGEVKVYRSAVPAKTSQ